MTFVFRYFFNSKSLLFYIFNALTLSLRVVYKIQYEVNSFLKTQFLKKSLSKKKYKFKVNCFLIF